MDVITIKYCFTFKDGSQQVFNLQLDAQKLELLGNTQESLPLWTKLDFHQCPNCSITTRTHSHCPMAVGLVKIVMFFNGFQSHDEVHLDVFAERRIISQDTTVQKGVSSLMGLIIATSGCPRADFFRPMAWYHMPLASVEETIFRAASTYLLMQYFFKKEGKNADLELEGLRNIYQNMHTVNVAVKGRLQAATETDSSLNAVILLDLFAQALPLAIDKSLSDLRNIFAPYH